MMVECLGLDGVYLMDVVRLVKKVCKDFGDDVIIGVFCNVSSYDGMIVGELLVDYVSFGFVGEILLGIGEKVFKDLF